MFAQSKLILGRVATLEQNSSARMTGLDFSSTDPQLGNAAEKANVDMFIAQEFTTGTEVGYGLNSVELFFQGTEQG